MILPDLGKIRDENSQILATLDLTNKRLDDVNTHLADQSRRIDDIRLELGQRIDDVRSELGHRIDDVCSELGQKIDETTRQIGHVQSDLIHRLDDVNGRLDLLFRDYVSNVEFRSMSVRLDRFENDMKEFKQRLAA